MEAVTLNVEQIRELATFVGLSVEVPDGLETDTRWNITPAVFRVLRRTPERTFRVTTD